MATELHERLFLAHNYLQQRRREKVSHAEMGLLVAQREGRKDEKGKVRPYSSGNVTRWINGAKTPDVETQKAFADVAGVTRAWLVLEEGEMVPHGAAALKLTDVPTRVAKKPSAAARKGKNARG